FEKVHRNPWITLEFHPAHRHDMHNRIEPGRRVMVHFLAAMVGVNYLATTFVEGIWHTRRDRRSLRPFRKCRRACLPDPLDERCHGRRAHTRDGKTGIPTNASCALRGKANEFAEAHLRYVSLAVLDKTVEDFLHRKDEGSEQNTLGAHRTAR